MKFKFSKIRLMINSINFKIFSKIIPLYNIFIIFKAEEFGNKNGINIG